jgi:hypothetical protein
MDLNIRTSETSAAVGNWLASGHGLDALRNVTLANADLASYTGVVPSGTPLSYDEARGVYVPYADADPLNATNPEGTGDLVCLLFSDVEVSTGTYSHGAGLDHGKALEANLPVAISDEAKASNTRIQFV